MISYFIMFILLFVSIVSDLKTSKIKNIHVLIAGLLGILTNSYYYGAKGFKLSTAGIVLPVVLLWIFFYLRLLGAGDIKLFSAIGALVGWQVGLYIMAYSILVAGVVCFIRLVRSGELIYGFRTLGRELKLCVYSGGNQAVSLKSRSIHIIKLSPSIAAGVGIQLLTKFVL